MDVQLAAGYRMNPQPGSVLGRRDLRRPLDDDEIIGLDAFQQFADVHVSMALHARQVAVIGDSPFIAPNFLALGYSSGPKFGALLRSHAGEPVSALGVESGKG